MMTLKPFVLALAAAQGRDLFLAPASVQQPQVFLAPSQPVYGAAAPQYVAVTPTYVASAEPAQTVSAGSAFVILAAAAVAGAAVGVAMNSKDRDVATLAVEGRDVNRRALLAAAAAASLPFAAMADDNEDSIARIAKKNAEKLAEDKAAKARAYQKTDADIEAEQQQSKNLILGIAGVGTLASGAFIIPNLSRLAIKVTSGGKDSGYETYANQQKRKGGRGGKKQPEFKEKSFGEKLFSAAFARPSDK